MKLYFPLLIFLAISLVAKSQEVISPSNFLKLVNPSHDVHERNINVNEVSFGYLISLTDDIPYNYVGDWYMSSARVIKTDAHGNYLASFSVAADTTAKKIFMALNAFVSDDEVLFIVSKDSAIYKEDPQNKGLIVYHLDSANLSFKSADTFFNLLPVGASINNWFAHQASAENFFEIIRCFSFPSGYRNMIFSMKNQNNQVTVSSSLSIDSALAFDFNALNLIFNTHWNKQFDSIEIFMTAFDSTNQQIFKLIKVDTTLSGLSSFDIPSYQYNYAPNKYVWPNLVCQGLRVNNKVILGPFFDNEVFKAVGLIKYNPLNNLYEKALIVPDSINFSFFWKTAPLFGGIEKKGNNIFCLGFDISDASGLYFDYVENHLYIGKTDTSLNQWDWYKYIGFSGCHIIPYKLLATSDGGCLITAGIYNYVNSLNLQHDIYVIKLDANGGITHVTNLSHNNGRRVSVYPVPAQQQLFLSYEGNESYDFYIYDMNGKTVFCRKGLTRNKSSLSIENLSSGSYVFLVKFTDGRTETGRLIKE